MDSVLDIDPLLGPFWLLLILKRHEIFPDQKFVGRCVCALMCVFASGYIGNLSFLGHTIFSLKLLSGDHKKPQDSVKLTHWFRKGRCLREAHLAQVSAPGIPS